MCLCKHCGHSFMVVINNKSKYEKTEEPIFCPWCDRYQFDIWTSGFPVVFRVTGLKEHQVIYLIGI